MTATATHDTVACAASQNPCFGCKMRVWREGGYSPFKPFHKDWRNTTVAEQVREVVTSAKQQGIEDQIAPVNSRWV